MRPPGYHHNGFMATYLMYLARWWLHIAGTNEIKSAQVPKQWV